MCQGITTIPLYDTQQPDTIQYIVEQTGMQGIACAAKQTETILKLRSEGGLQSLRILIQFEEVTEQLKESFGKLGMEIMTLAEVAVIGKVGEDQPPSPNTIYTICYTSGTTGRSKGAVITQQNMISTLAGIIAFGIDFSSDDSYMSYLPLAHMLERIISQFVILHGAQYGFYAGDVLKIREDLAELKPTVFVSVPRLFNRFHDLIQQQFASATGVKKMLVSRGLSAKMYGYETTGTLVNSVWDKLVFSKVKNVLGGRVRLMLTGSAPISGDVLKFLRLVFSCPILEGYGQTETCAGSVLTEPTDTGYGYVGGPIATLEIKLVDVPDMNYFSTDVSEDGQRAPRGEVCFRGPPVFKGYYKSPEQTAEAIDEEG
mmetsp:Transcript_25929/g.25487  ORF Transcript_25929/g.25487 Transcript_25929/m.25487 type:complete len:372 (+) Transcript_25929:398-1513(+)